MRIWLVRHGESLGNVHETAWQKIPDHCIPLTEFGIDQAKGAGEQIRKYYEQNAELKDKKVRLWYSPYLRTQQTKDGVAWALGPNRIENKNRSTGTPGWEDDRLREQDFGMFSRLTTKEEQFKKYPDEAAHFYNAMDNKGRYWAKAPLGNSRADVTAQVGDFINSMMRDNAHGHEDMVVVTHGVTMRAFEKRFMHYDIEWFEKEPNPKNCDVVLIEGDAAKGYTVTKMFPGLQRAGSIPPDYKADPVGGWDILKSTFGFEKPPLGR